MALKYSNSLILRGDRVQFQSNGYNQTRYFNAIVLHVYQFGEADTRKWKVLIDDGLGNPRVVQYTRLRFYAP